MSKTSTLTAEEEQAVQEYAAREGRCWKSALRMAWYNASEPGILQALRNDRGPEWLRKYRLPKKRSVGCDCGCHEQFFAEPAPLDPIRLAITRGETVDIVSHPHRNGENDVAVKRSSSTAHTALVYIGGDVVALTRQQAVQMAHALLCAVGEAK